MDARTLNEIRLFEVVILNCGVIEAVILDSVAAFDARHKSVTEKRKFVEFHIESSSL